MKEKFALWDALFIQYLKRDWKKIIFWIVGMSVFSGAFIPAFVEIAKGSGLVGMYETMKNPAMIAMVGPSPVSEAGDYTLGVMYSNMMLLFCGLFAMIISILHVISHTRKEEEQGLSELIRSFRVGRQANSLAVFIENVLVNVLIALATAGIMLVFDAKGINAEGALLFGASIAAAGIIGGVLAQVIAQIMPTSTSTTGASLGIVGLLYMLRAMTDMSNIDMSMWNPMGWTYLTYPFSENKWLPLAFVAAFSLVMMIFAFILEENRDIDAGYLPERGGRGEAKGSLLSVPGLFLRINRGVMISWLIGFVAMGAAYGSIYGDMQTFLESNDLLKQMFTATGASIEESFTGTIMMVMIFLVAILPIVVINKLFTEESHLHLSQLYSTKVSRGSFYWATIILALLGSVAGVALAAVSLGGTAISAMGDKSTMDIMDFLKVGFNSLPSVLIFAGLAALLVGWAPKLGKVVYVYLAYSFVLSYFKGILDLPEWFSKTAVQSWIPNMPMEKFDPTVFAVLTIISIALLIVGYLGYARRDMVEGA